MKVEIWSDIACPFCYIGKTKFQMALDQFAHSDEVNVNYRAFQIDPTAKETNKMGEMTERLMKAYLIEGLDIGDHDTLINLAAEIGLDTTVLQFYLNYFQYCNLFP